jgi:hypothetical protein
MANVSVAVEIETRTEHDLSTVLQGVADDQSVNVGTLVMLKLETQADLEALHAGNIKESISLEYKASPAIDKKDDNKKTEMARDVSAFANADGGQIVYGMTEKDH